MMTGHFPVDKFRKIDTPFYYYDMEVLRASLKALSAAKGNAEVHYAIKACATTEVLKEIAKAGFGADCVSGGEIKAAVEAGFPKEKIVFAGVAKADWEIRLALTEGIGCFNVESLPELELIADLAAELDTTARVCLRINPNVDPHTHHLITTGLRENKFGIQIDDLPEAYADCQRLKNIQFVGLHFHIGSQITDMMVFANLSQRINEIMTQYPEIAQVSKIINVGGGLGILYEHPNHFPIPDYAGYFATFKTNLQLLPTQTMHCELGRSVVAQCGSLITKVLYVKKGHEKQFAIVDAGMTDLIRPALYNAFHRIENISNNGPVDETYDVVGPICESSDVFVRDFVMARVERGDLLAMRSAGAYGEIMASQYNLRRLPGHVTSDEL